MRYARERRPSRRRWECMCRRIGGMEGWVQGNRGVRAVGWGEGRISLNARRIVKGGKKGKNGGTRARARNPTDVASAKSVQRPYGKSPGMKSAS